MFLVHRRSLRPPAALIRSGRDNQLRCPKGRNFAPGIIEAPFGGGAISPPSPAIIMAAEPARPSDHHALLFVEQEEFILLGGGGGSTEMLPAAGRGFSLDRFESTLNRASKWMVTVLVALFILWSHNGETMWMLCGYVANNWLSLALKQVLNHQRPDSALRHDPGMPSTHAQNIFYFAIFVLLYLVHSSGLHAWTLLVGAITLLCASYLTWLRVSQRLHTVGQVVVGAVIGSAFAAAWFSLWHSYVLGAFVSSVWVRVGVVFGSVVSYVFSLVHYSCIQASRHVVEGDPLVA